MADTAALVVALSAQLTKFERDMKEAAQIADRGVKRIEDSFKGVDIGGALNKSIAAFVSGGALLAVARQIHELIEQVDRIGDAAEVVGVTAQQFQELTFAIVASGQSAEKAEQFMQRFSRAVSDAQRGQGDLAEIFKANQIDAANLNVQEALFKFADLVRNAKTQQDALNLAMTVGGRQAGPSLVLALQAGADGLRHMAEQGQRLGVVLDEDVTGKADEITKAYDVMALQVTRFFQRMAVGIGDTIKGIIDEIKGIEAETSRQRTQFVTVRPAGPATTLPDASVDKFQKLIEAQQRRVELLKNEQDTLGQSVGVQAQYRTQIELEAAAKSQNIELTDARLAAIKQEAAAVGEATQKLAEQKAAFNDLQSASRDLGQALADAFKGAVIEGQKFDEVLRNLANRLASKSIDKLFDLAFAPQGGATSSIFADLLKGLKGFASGGSVKADQPVVVGEKGPELFVPNQSGMIVPNKVVSSKNGGGVNLTIQNNVDASGADSAAIARLERGLAASNASIEQRAVNAVAAHRARFG